MFQLLGEEDGPLGSLKELTRSGITGRIEDQMRRQDYVLGASSKFYRPVVGARCSDRLTLPSHLVLHPSSDITSRVCSTLVSVGSRDFVRLPSGPSSSPSSWNTTQQLCRLDKEVSTPTYSTPDELLYLIPLVRVFFIHFYKNCNQDTTLSWHFLSFVLFSHQKCSMQDFSP